MGFYRVYGYDNFGNCIQNFIIAKSKDEAIEKTWWIPENNKQAYFNSRPSKQGVIKAKAVEQYYNFFTRYFRPSEIENRFEDWFCKSSFKDYQKNMDFIRCKIEDGYKVACGYKATAIKGFHEHLIFYIK